MPEAVRVRDLNVARKMLHSVDWSFAGPFGGGRVAAALFDARKYHWYPGTFIPEIPYTLIEILTQPNAAVYDPFGGIGTTCFQAASLGRRPFMTDVCRVGLAVARSLWSLLRPSNVLPDADGIMNEIRREFDPGEDYVAQVGSEYVRMEELQHWYAPTTLNQLAFLTLLQTRSAPDARGAAVGVTLSATLKAASGQDRGWGCIADNMRPREDQLATVKDAFERIERNLRGLLRDLGTFKSELTEDAALIFEQHTAANAIFEMDVRRSVPLGEATVDAIVTSPPYPEMTDYATSQRLSYYWSGGDPKADVNREIGARRKRFRGDSLSDYKNDMTRALSSFLPVVKPGGYACFVMPYFDSETSSNAARKALVEEVMGSIIDHGFSMEEQIERALPVRRRHHNQNWTSLSKERITIYRRAT